MPNMRFVYRRSAFFLRILQLVFFLLALFLRTEYAIFAVFLNMIIGLLETLSKP